MKLADFLVMTGLKLLIRGYLENTLCNTTPPFKNSENSVMTQALIYLSECNKSKRLLDIWQNHVLVTFGFSFSLLSEYI